MNISIAQAAASPLAPFAPSAGESGMVPIDDARLYYAAYGDPNNEPIVLKEIRVIAGARSARRKCPPERRVPDSTNHRLVHGRLGNADELVHQIPDWRRHT